MTPLTGAPSLARRFGRLCVASFVLAAASAQAALITPIDVRLLAPGGNALDPTPVDVSTTLASPAAVITPDGAFAPNLLPLERIALDAGADALLITVQQGDESGGTGWLSSGADRARYLFSGLALSQGPILGLTVASCDGYAASCAESGVTGGVSTELLDLDASIAGFDALAFHLDVLQFRDRGLGASENFADFRLTLTSRSGGGGGDVPEPGSAALATLALGALVALGRRRAERA